MTEQEQVQVTQADRDAAAALAINVDEGWIAPPILAGNRDPYAWVQAFARHRHTATAEALEAMREAREALEHGSGYLIEDCGFEAGDEPAEQMEAALTRLTAAIAKIEGEQP
jgi:hypothetical protein